MSVQVADNVAALFDGAINVNEPLDWEFLGVPSTCSSWSRWYSYAAGQCTQTPSGEVWCARRNIQPGEVGPGEVGWERAWRRQSTMLGADYAAEATAAQRHHGRGGVMVGADPAAEAAYAQRHGHLRGQPGVRPVLGALVADYHVLKEIARGQAGLESEMLGAENDPVRTTQKVIARARDMQSPALPPKRVVHFDEVDEISVDPVREEILGQPEFDAQSFPLATSLYKHFQGKAEPKFVRLDTEMGYRDFRADQSPEIAELRQKVATLDALLHAHMADGHGSQDILVGLASDISQLQSATADRRVPLQMPPWAEGTWDCWREEGPRGGLICCSIALPGHDGYVRVCTAASPIDKHVEDVVGYTHDIGGNVVTLLGVLPTLACMMAGGRLMTELAAAAPAVLAHPGSRGSQPFIGKIVPANHPTLATLIALLQHAQSGNPQAVGEWSTLAKLAQDNADLALSMSEARRRLLATQGGILGWSRR